jgi:hypothetical protein
VQAHVRRNANFFTIDQFDSVEIGNINIQMQDLSGRRNTNDMDIEP